MEMVAQYRELHAVKPEKKASKWKSLAYLQGYNRPDQTAFFPRGIAATLSFAGIEMDLMLCDFELARSFSEPVYSMGMIDPHIRQRTSETLTFRVRGQDREMEALLAARGEEVLLIAAKEEWGGNTVTVRGVVAEYNLEYDADGYTITSVTMFCR